MGKWTIILLLIIAFVAYEMGYLPINLDFLFSTPGEGRVDPFLDGSCPHTVPVKGSFTSSSSGLCIYHVRGQDYYDRTQAERCYATEGDAKRDGCTRAKDPDL